MTVKEAINPQAWDSFLVSRRFSPFLQSWTMGEVYREIGEEPIRLEARENGEIVGICFAHLVAARRGRHLSLPYGPVVSDPKALHELLQQLITLAREKNCSFIRVSPFLPLSEAQNLMTELREFKALPSPLHLLAEHLWYLPLKVNDPWNPSSTGAESHGSPLPDETTRTEDEIFKAMRSTTRNLVRRAQKEGVTVRASTDPARDIDHFLKLHDETRKRHGFTPYTNAFFRAQVRQFSETHACTLYLADYQGEVIASSIHMHFGGETSYHHGASSYAHSKIPASYLLQWTAIADALKRGDRVYNFWGIAPEDAKDHPFAGVTLFKTGFGGSVLPLVHCLDLPLSPLYRATRAFEYLRKWKRGF